MLAHLGQDGADVKMDVAGVRDLQTVVYSMLAEVQVVVLDLECFLEVGQRAAKFLGAAEHTGEVVVRDGAVAITFLRQAHCFVKQLQRDLEVLYKCTK